MSLKAEKLEHKYNAGTTLESYALKGIDLEIEKGEFVGLIGRTGSGKSTLIQHFNGLLKPTGGRILFDGKDISEKGYSLKILRQKVGLVFQYPEYQLFEETIIKDVAYGPMNKGMSQEEALKAAQEALRLVGIQKELYNKSPFEVSGGQKRRVAVAGVLAIHPDYLILDEPTAGLDPEGREAILGLFRSLHEKLGITIIMVSHSMEDVARYAKRLIVMNEGSIAYDDTPREVFRHTDELENMGLSAPQSVHIARALKQAGFDVPGDAITVDELVKPIIESMR
ncbi:MAG: energy-coupling factor transporter ATPase [Lachnospiraceae bacterium]|nr:energy-coupling factor transporter ATPase [Lachnospiraceae bacterium]